MTKTIQPTPEFLKFAAKLHQDIFEIHNSPEEALETALNELSKAEQLSLRDFLESAIRSQLSDESLYAWWIDSSADVFLEDPRQVRPFYQQIVDLIPQR
ncbi:hypothetical protein [Pelagibius sp.]|uniref:hypothetical protein n=1 Tax=Pelagibius sp. TaxID=1931238 RepID=UPI002608510D|nr:hypothetical protein [Pelagibius sp.]